MRISVWSSFVSSSDLAASIADYRSPPGEATAHCLQDDEIVLLDPAVADGHVQRQRDRRRRCVGMLVDSDDDLFGRKPKLLGGGVEDALVGLVRHDQIDLVGAVAGAGGTTVERRGEGEGKEVAR